MHPAQFPAVTGPFYAAERHARIRHHHLVDEHHPGVDLIGEAVALGGVVRPRARAQPEAAVVGEADRGVDIRNTEDRRHRTEQLFPISRRVFRNVGENRRRIEAAGAVDRLASRKHPRARFDGCVDIGLKGSYSIRRSQRTEFGRRVHRIAHFQGLHFSDKDALELVGDVLGHDEPFRRYARLPVVDHTRFDGGVDGQIQIGAGHHDEGIAAAQFEHDLLDSSRRRDAYFHTRSLAPGQRSGGDARIAEDRVHLLRADQQRLECAFRETRTLQYFLYLQSALRHVRSMFQKPHIARHQARRDEPEYLPEREVPRHDGEYDAHGLVLDVAAFGVGRDLLVGEKTFGVLGVIAAGPRALHGFVDGRAKGLAHFEGHQTAQILFIAFENARRFVHHRGALGEG